MGEPLVVTCLDGYRRYAVYYAPPRESELGRFGAAWLGWDAEAARMVDRPSLSDLPCRVEDLTDGPARYGFHATLKAPFRLAHGRSAEDLGQAVAALAASEPPFSLPPLTVSSLGNFLALVPTELCPRLLVLAARCVVDLDVFRAPLAPEERSRRVEGLGEREGALLDRWGYPFVMEAFRFHLTLTGQLDSAARDASRAALSRALAPMLCGGETFSDLCLFGEQDSGSFRLLRRYTLGSSGRIPTPDS